MDQRKANYRSAAKNQVPENLEGLRSTQAVISSVCDYSASIDAEMPNHELFAIQGFDVLLTLASATNEKWDVEKYVEWRHQSISPIGKKRLEPYIIRREVEEAVAMYLELPYRVEILDRMLVDASIASEFFAFLDEPHSRIPSFGKALLFQTATLLFVWWLADGEDWGWYVMAASFGLFCWGWIYSRKQRQKVRNMIMSMNEAYLTLDGHPSSIKQITNAVEKASERGVVWNTSLFVLLEDVAKRRDSI